MKLCGVDDWRLGLVREGNASDVTMVLERIDAATYPRTSGDPVISQLEQLRPLIGAAANDAPSRAIGDVRFLSPVARPTKIIGTPANYLKHVEEAGANLE